MNSKQRKFLLQNIFDQRLIGTTWVETLRREDPLSRSAHRFRMLLATRSWNELALCITFHRMREMTQTLEGRKNSLCFSGWILELVRKKRTR